MGDDFKVGDVVVCVDVAPRSWHKAVHRAHMKRLNLGKYYTVLWCARDTDVGNDRGGYTIGLVEIPVNNAPGWDAARFRKLRKADDSFIRQLRALTPKEDNHA